MTANMPVVSDSFTQYLAEVRKFSLLSEEEEHLYAVKFFEEKDLEAAHKLITSNLRFVIKVAAEYRHYGLKMLDIIQEGNIGLMMAVRKFNPYKGIRLISYAVWWIKAYIQNHIISTWSLLKIGTTQAQRKLFFKLREAKQALMKLGGYEDGDIETKATAKSLNVTEQDVVEMEQRLQGEAYLDAELAASGGLTSLDMLRDDRMNQEELLAECQEQLVVGKHLSEAVAMLNEKEKYIVERRIAHEDPLTLQEIAEHFSISRERVRQIEENALRKLKIVLQPRLRAA